jgi:hypothetical protein
VTLSRLAPLAIGSLLSLAFGCAGPRLRSEGLPPTGAPSAALKELLATERAFAKLAAEKGTNAAFRAYIAEDAILFRPDPINGKVYLDGNPDSPGQLTWRPIRAFMASSGRIGWTSGPWEYRTSATDPSPAATGTFFTVWERQEDGAFRFLVDGGVSHPPVPGPAVERLHDLPAGLKPESFLEAVLLSEGRFGGLWNPNKNGFFARALEDSSGPELMVLREGTPPLEGQAAIQRLWNELPMERDAGTTQYGKGSLGSDLSFSYVDYAKDRPDGTEEHGHRVRIWRREPAGKNLLVLDAELPLPQAKQE